MFDDLNLTNCPDKFALNCKRYDIKCHECKANDKGKHLLYLPINKSIKDHPAKNEPKKKIVSYSRKGKAQEQKTINKSEVLERTIGSGSYVGDGDAYIPLLDIGRVRVEHKTRYNNKNLFNPTSTELKEGLNQNIKVWYIVNGSQPYLEPQVFVKYNVIAKIIGKLFTHKDIRVQVNKDIKNSFVLHVFPKSKLWKPIDLDYKYVIVKRGLKLSKKDSDYINFFRFIIAKTPYGKFCYLDLNLFEKLVKNYLKLI